jgi:hypothetical protein
MGSTPAVLDRRRRQFSRDLSDDLNDLSRRLVDAVVRGYDPDEAAEVFGATLDYLTDQYHQRMTAAERRSNAAWYGRWLRGEF